METTFFEIFSEVMMGFSVFNAPWVTVVRRFTLFPKLRWNLILFPELRWNIPIFNSRHQLEIIGAILIIYPCHLLYLVSL